MNSANDVYSVYAIKYAYHERRAAANFIGGDPHDLPMPMDYFVWVLIGGSRVFVVDTGFSAAMAKRRGRVITQDVEAGLARIGVAARDVEDVIITHMHYDHAGNLPLFPKARFHVQDREMAFCTGRCMVHEAFSVAFEADDVKSMIDRVFERRVRFHDGETTLAPGLSVHWVGGHTAGLQIVRVNTARGWIVLASDASHYYANMEQERPYPLVYNVNDMVEGYAKSRLLAASAADVIPGHDPQVLARYPAHSPGTEGWIVRLDAAAIGAGT